MTSQEQEEIKRKMSALLVENPEILKSLEASGSPIKNFVKLPIDVACESFITVDPTTIETKRRARLFAPLDYPCLIEGPSGVGKELMAKILHGNRQGNFVAINCSALPTTLLESILFGHTAGCFTGAKDKTGLLEHAENGTLFLDEIGDMPLELQAKLLRVLQNKTYRRLGENIEKTTTARFIAATHSAGKIRTDLYYRLSALSLTLKPLSDRPCDIVPIAKWIAKKNNIAWTETIEQQLGSLGFFIRGNVRELENILIQLSITL